MASYVCQGYREGHGPRPVGHSLLPTNQIHAAAVLGLEDGRTKHGTSTQGGPRAAYLLKELFTLPFEQYPSFLSPWWGCSDSSASAQGDAYVGRWCSDATHPSKAEVFWFHYQIKPAEHPWAFKDGNPQKRIAALELLRTLLLCKRQHGPALGRVRLPVGSDNSGNIFSLLNLSSKSSD